jgi:hypothetical protein
MICWRGKRCRESARILFEVHVVSGTMNSFMIMLQYKCSFSQTKVKIKTQSNPILSREKISGKIKFG